ncbi:chromate reductase [Mesorhizobium soli]|uniref:NADPH-dependent FMN reductase n=1 Tax=Pseudaminobacter soli (ex Li et al. 2025) TaxID=1295366 RepID=UPI0024764B53|nr:NADPH-dependent FMN reductase [Mesorhizobium soli]MDH6231427.1 chromate reductase [Mesorhizobium soli]
MMRLLCICGSLRATSTNMALLHALRDTAPPEFELAVYDGLGGLPIFSPDEEAERTPPQVSRLIEAVALADGLIIACPEYAHGVPGGLKNALDWLVSGEAPIGKPVMLVHASPRSMFARAALREILKTMSLAVFDGAELEVSLIGKKPPDFEPILSDPVIRDMMRASLVEFGRFIKH